MKKFIQNLTHLIVALCLWTLAWLAVIQTVETAGNLFAFITWTSFVIFLVSSTSSKAQEAIKKSHIEGKHAPLWFDVLTYLPIVIACAAHAHHWKGAAWLIIMLIDLSHRAQFKDAGDPSKN